MYFHRRTYIYHRARSETLVLSQKKHNLYNPQGQQAELGIY